MEDAMKIAICLSGQPRTWAKCYPRWMEIFKDHEDIDFFFHLWDYNTLPNLLATYNGGTEIKDQLLTIDEKVDLITTLNPKKYLFESRKKIDYWNCNIPVHEQLGPWCIEQYYSRYYVSILKQQYELDNNFKYDLVIWQRTDTYPSLETKITLTVPEPNTLYTTHNRWDEELGIYRIGDIFYYSDSATFDQMALIYKFFSFTPSTWITSSKCPPPEVAFYTYMANIGIINSPIHGDFKVMRDNQVLEIKGKLDGYEII